MCIFFSVFDMFPGRGLIQGTGGIRCEKASAFLRRRLKELDADASTPVYQLEGGIPGFAYYASLFKGPSSFRDYFLHIFTRFWQILGFIATLRLSLMEVDSVVPTLSSTSEGKCVPLTEV